MEVTQSLHRMLQQKPDEIATVFGDRVRTWRESAERVARLAGGLRGLGVPDGGCIGILALNSDRYHELLFAVPWAGYVLLPINVRWSAAEIAYSLEESGTQVLVVDDAFAEIVPELRERCAGLRQVIRATDGPAGHEQAIDFEAMISDSEPIDDRRRGRDDLAVVFYTGGTTGHPKGVMLSHRNVLTSTLGAIASGVFMDPEPRILHVAPLFHLAAVAGWLACNALGGRHVIAPRWETAEVARTIESQAVTNALLPIPMLQMLVDDPVAREADLSSLRQVLYGTAPISEALLHRTAERLPDVRLTQAYGMTETAAVSTVLGPEEHLDPTLRRSAGRAAPHAELRVVGPHDEPLPTGTVGEVQIRGEHVMLGYWGQPETTADALRGGWMHTGDGGYLDDRGYVYIVDRLKDMIITGGENVYSTEVENVVARHEAVAACAVIGVPDARWGERVHAVIVPTDGARPDADEIREHCKRHIAGYKAPRTISLLDELPVSATGKVLKRELRERFADAQV